MTSGLTSVYKPVAQAPESFRHNLVYFNSKSINFCFILRSQALEDYINFRPINFILGMYYLFISVLSCRILFIVVYTSF